LSIAAAQNQKNPNSVSTNEQRNTGIESQISACFVNSLSSETISENAALSLQAARLNYILLNIITNI